MDSTEIPIYFYFIFLFGVLVVQIATLSVTFLYGFALRRCLNGPVADELFNIAYFFLFA